MSRRLLTAYEFRLILGQHLCAVFVHTHGACDSGGGFFIVTRHHDDLFNTRLMQCGNRGVSFGTQRVGNAYYRP